jgi:RimJ/RimL family protein N-acetyltransferase
MNIIETERLTFQEFTENDGELMLKILNTEDWKKYIGDRKVETIEKATEYLKVRMLWSYDKFGFGMYKVLLKSTDEFIGLCGLGKRPELENVEIGYALLPEFYGKGYGIEAAKGTIDFAKNNLKINTLVAITAKNNDKSHRILEQLDMKIINNIKLSDDDEEIFLFSTNHDD